MDAPQKHEEPSHFLVDYGLDFYPGKSAVVPPHLTFGRVVATLGPRYQIVTSHGLRSAELSGKLSYLSAGKTELPCVGDWVYGFWENPENSDKLGLVIELCPRKNSLKRGLEEGAESEQVLAANIDSLIVLWSLEKLENFRELSENRQDDKSAIPTPRLRFGGIERLTSLARAEGIPSIVLFSKADLLSPTTVTEFLRQARERFPAAEVHAISTKEGTSTRALLRNLLKPGSSAALLGPSGSGKSSLVACMLQNHTRADDGPRPQALREPRRAEVRSKDKKGRHTTTHREFFRLPWGALLLDTPGLREIALNVEAAEMMPAFERVRDLAQRCRFNDCTHEDEPGCAVLEALASGTLEAGVFYEYKRQAAEIHRLDLREAEKNRSKNKETLSFQTRKELDQREDRWKKIHKSIRNFSKEKRSGL